MQPDHVAERPVHRWRPFADLPADRTALLRVVAELTALRRAWTARRTELEACGALAAFSRRLNRLWSIETGIIEGLYTVSRGLTTTLVEHGFDAAYVSHGETDVPAGHLIDVLRDHEQAIEWGFAFVRQDRALTTSYIKESHALLTAHQPGCEAVTQFGDRQVVPLRRGDWKLLPNNPGDPRTGAECHEYAPPEQTPNEMERLVALHAMHGDIAPEIEAAWLHHRFVQIHPFQDGNGRVARLLASLVLIRGGGFPFVVQRDERGSYFDCLRAADDGDLVPFAEMICAQQRAAIRRAIEEGAGSLMDAPAQGIDAILDRAAGKLRQAAAGRRGPAFDLATRLRDRASARLLRTARDVQERIHGVPGVEVETRDSADGDARAFESEVASAALERGWLLARDGDRVWACIHVSDANRGDTYLIVSFSRMEGLGPDLMGATMTAITGSPRRCVPACTEPFTFTADRDASEVTSSFDAWFERSLALALAVWTRGL